MSASVVVPRGGVIAVTGAAGYVGSYVCKALSEAGYSVRALVRDISNNEKNGHLKDMRGVEMCEIPNMMEKDAFLKPLQGVDGVVHAAAVVSMSGGDDVVVKPTLEGTKNLIDAVKQIPSIKQVVGTSSIAAVTNFAKSDDYIHSEKDVPDLNEPANKLAYCKAKTLEEELLWSFQKETGTHVTTINPGMVFGPVIAKRHATSASPTMIRLALTSSPLFPMHTRTVDVRDVADAHVKAFQLPEAYGERFILVSDDKLVKISDLGSIVHDVRPKYISTSVPLFSDRIVTLANYASMIPVLGDMVLSKLGMSRAILANLVRSPNHANTKSKDILGIKYISREESIGSTIDCMVSKGFFKPA